MGCMVRLLSVIAGSAVLIFFIGFLSLFHDELGFSGLMAKEDWDAFQMLTISGGLLITFIAGTLVYIFRER